ncbi:2-methoxy-6-polyprenyl-1,4-benzoquinol methylase, mitochondrial [Paenibacillus sp. JJ-100]|uniref:MerR family transcriptional regulator n=1 Tax=Paenibacillus sp. JJ-100 TaxID=2974896 RepID=UPI0022FFC059|nr:MerR family transcriptional regulator [Paenibacillus sp. JJ-100]CAI6080962.1 2-methoxy-6-polyprenyl-1,4-benzoquinol methylase, mitochondrial [Paenibacillus sp. JJ-100]
MNIKEAASRLGISARAIRFYEEKGLIRPAKQSGNGYRVYTENDIWRLQTIAALREIGMSLQDITHALAEIDQGNQQGLEEYLELQQAVMYAQWVELKRMMDTTQRMIDLNRQDGALDVSYLHDLAGSARRLREARQNWHDRWNYDRQAAIHDQRVQAEGNTADKPFNLYHNYDEALEQTAQWISPVIGEVGLDIGTGTGNLAGKMLDKGAIMTGIDQSREMLRNCRKKYPQMQVKLGNFLALPFADQSFDFVVSSFAFHHLGPDQQYLALEEIQRVLKTTSTSRICLTDLMFTDSDHRVAYSSHAATAGDAEQQRALRERHFSLLSELCRWLSHLGYETKYIRHNELLHTVLAFPVR